MPTDSLGFHNYFLYCPLDNDFKNYRKDNILYLKDNCFNCDNIKVSKLNGKLLYSIPVKFVKDKDSNPIEFDKEELLNFLKKDSCLECKIIYPRLPGKTEFTNSFLIPSKEILNVINQK